MFLIKLRRQLFLQAESRRVSAKLTHNLRLVFALFFVIEKNCKKRRQFFALFRVLHVRLLIYYPSPPEFDDRKQKRNFPANCASTVSVRR